MIIFFVTMVYANEPGKIALIQYNADVNFGRVNVNLTNLSQMATEAVEAGANIVVMPEGSAYGYASDTHVWCSPEKMNDSDGQAFVISESRNYIKQCADVLTVAESIEDGKVTQFWTSFAREHQVYIIFSIIEKNQSENKFYNTMVITGPNGYELHYRKRVLYKVDQAYAESGEQAKVWQSPYGNFGLMICMDATYDEGTLQDPNINHGEYCYRDYAYRGDVDALILQMNWDDDPHGDYAARTWFQKRAECNAIDIYASDVSAWDGTGKYPKDGSERLRNGLAAIAIDEDGISYHSLNYPKQ